MGTKLPVSWRTLLLFLIVFDFSASLTSAFADDRRKELEDEVSAAQNALDALVLKPGANPSDPAIQRKRDELNEKQKSLSEYFLESNRRKSGTNSRHGDTMLEGKSVRSESNPEPETVLSGEGIPSEIRYPKGRRQEAKQTPSQTPNGPMPAAGPPSTPDPSSGLSEIQYPKKANPKRK